MLTRYTFGVEFEVIFPPAFGTLAGAADRLAAASGLPVTLAPRLGAVSRDNPAFRIVSDGSVRGAGLPGEVVSPILQGQDGLDKVAKIADSLRAIGATVNPSCGFHVHVGNLRGADLSFFKNLAKLYAKFEPVIDSLMPPSRRGNANHYCRSHAIANTAAIDNAGSLDSVIEATTGVPVRGRNAQAARYFKLNLAAHKKHSTVEFRQHAGTVDSKKAIAWIKTCLRMVAAARDGKTGNVPAAPADFSTLTDSKTRKTAEFVTRPNGASRREILEGTGWAALSVNRQARLAGIQIREMRANGETRYYAIAASETPIDLPSFLRLIEATEEESAFLAQRHADLAQG